MKKTLALFVSLVLLMSMVLASSGIIANAETSPKNRVGYKLDKSLFDADVQMYNTNVSAPDGSHLGSSVSGMFDNDYFTAWDQAGFVTAGWEYLRPYLTISFKNNRRYVITNIEVYGQTDGKRFPKQFVFEANDGGGAKYTKSVDALSPAAWGSFMMYTQADISCKSFGLQMVGNINEQDLGGTTGYALLITELIIYGYEVGGNSISSTSFNSELTNNQGASALDYYGDKSIWFDGTKYLSMCFSVGENNGTFNPMLKLNFNIPYVITEIKLYGRGDNIEGFPTKLGVLTGDQNGTFTKALDDKNIVPPTPGTPYDYVLNKEIITSSLGIEMTGGISGDLSALMLSEIEVYGYPKATPIVTPVKLDSSIFTVSTQYKRDFYEGGEVGAWAGSVSNLFNGNYIEEWIPNGVFGGSVNPAERTYSRPTVKIDFNNGKNYIITEVKVYASWNTANFPNNFNFFTKANGSYVPYYAEFRTQDMTWDGIAAPYSVKFNKFVPTSGLAIEMQSTDADAHTFSIAEVEVYGYEVNKGDVNLDEGIDICDMIALRNIVLKQKSFYDAQIVTGDFNGDNKIDMWDLLSLKDMIMQLY